ncbi:MAG: hypothetical protein GEU92_12135 [Alphaproteobacteria bacterium]|nr:hypothetical protein [Alphaproteobacteria bacterium]
MAVYPGREAVGVFDDFASLQGAADELLTSGFNRADLSLLASRRRIVAKRGKPYANVREAEDDRDAPFINYIGPDSPTVAQGFLVAIGVYVGAVGAALVGATQGLAVTPLIGMVALAGLGGGAVGGAAAWALRREHGNYLREQLADGGLLLWVRIPDETKEARATGILERHGARDVHVHELPHRVETGVHGVSADLAWSNRPLFRKLAKD